MGITIYHVKGDKVYRSESTEEKYISGKVLYLGEKLYIQFLKSGISFRNITKEQKESNKFISYDELVSLETPDHGRNWYIVLIDREGNIFYDRIYKCSIINFTHCGITYHSFLKGSVFYPYDALISIVEGDFEDDKKENNG